MLKIIKLFNEYQDKVNHFIAGQAVALVLLLIGWEISLMAVFLIAISKEAWDSQGNGTVEVWDALATILGGVVIVGLFLL
ncbi:MAG: hypothetical protein QXT77_05355 [Candidatus Methanomethylicaceae archaeon]